MVLPLARRRLATTALAAALSLATLILAGLTLAGCGGDPPAAVPAVQVIAVPDRQAAPPFTGELLDGTGSYDLAAHTGEVVVINFWGSWCGPCHAEADDLEQTYQQTKADRVSFIGVNVRDNRDEALGFIRDTGTTYPSVFDPASRLALGFAVPPTAIPSTVIVDRQGRVAVVIRAAVTAEQLRPLLTELAAEPGSGSGSEPGAQPGSATAAAP